MTTLLSDGQVEFRFFRPEAVHIRIAGSFSRWLPVLEMQALSNGWWRALLALPPGVHRFRYEVDGRWFTDFAASGVEPACQNLHSPCTLDSIVIVPETA